MSNNNNTTVSYVIRAGGGFSMEQYFGEIPYIGTNGTDLTQLYDLTNTLQINYDVRIFNEKLGIYKDPTNEIVIDSSNNIIQDNQLDFITLSVNDFLNNITAAQITSLGKYSKLYTEFVRKTNTYFGYADGFARIFDVSGTTNVHSTPFSANELINILKERHIDTSGNDVYKLSGNINIYQITNLLSFMIANNPFLNRVGKVRLDGFIAGDRILIEAGITITLDLTIFNASYINNPLYGNTTILQYTLNAPLLLTLQNLS